MQKQLILSLFILITLASCEQPESLEWNSHLQVPVAYAKLDVKNLIIDSGEVINQDNSISLRLDQEVYQFKPLDNLVGIDIEPFIRKITIDELSLDNVDFNQNYTMQQLIEDAGFGSLLSDGISLPSFLIPNLGDVAPEPIEVDISEYFEKAVLEEGIINLTIKNELPFNVNNLSFSVLNASNNLELYSKTISSIPSRSEFTETDFDLAANLDKEEIEGGIKVVTNSLEVSVPPSKPTLTIDYTDYINFQFNLQNLKVESATAVFPSQTLTAYEDEIEIDVEDDIQLTTAQILSGNVKINVRSTIPTEIFLNYEIPSATLNGATYKLSESIEAATSGVAAVIEETFSMSEYTFDFTGISETETNKFYNTVEIKIEATETPIRITKQDTLYVELTVNDLVPKKVNGYMGQKMYDIGPDSVIFEGLPDYLDAITFEKASLDLTLTNSSNVEATCSVLKLDAKNTVKNEKVVANLSENSFTLPAENSTTVKIINATELLAVAPNQIDYNLSLQLNPEGNTPPFSNEIDLNDSITASMSLEVPLKVKIENLSFRDTLEFTEEINLDDQELQETILRVVAKNTFPISADLKIYFADDAMLTFDSILTPRPISAGEVINDRVKEASLSVFNFDLTQPQIESLLKSSFILIEAKLNTDHPDYVTLYSDYLMDISLVLDTKVNIDATL